MKSAMILLALAATTAFSSFAVGSITYSKEAVTRERIHKMLSEKFNATMTEKGLIIIVNEGMKYGVSLDEKREIVTIQWAMSTTKGTIEKRRSLCEKYNADKVFVRFYLDKDNDYVADYMMPYDGGLNSDNLKTAVSWFCSVVGSFSKAIDTEVGTSN